VDIDDQQIINDILNGDKGKYALLTRKYNQRLYRISKGYLKDESEIEDVMQDSYVKAFQSLSKFENKSQFSTWLTRILINECLQRLRKDKKEYAMDVNDDYETMKIMDHDNPEKRSLNKELKALLERAISNLPDKYRLIFLMREIEKMSIEETCSALDISEANVKVRLSRAKEMLRNTLMDTYPAGNLYEFNLVRCERIAANVLTRI
jgi:RNA polymerase sigma-70 factor (ECF subfamily)